ncbi:hypothetical protein CEP54_008164 [Fusarium duplospermum]|uniref:Uncharacterized protein n=1 Tax=Fusarium duplospermum TaxID=1325734 RepID=A0A428PXN1_9HYPO|nr:hypothetical protein CEP54_008164 [Fusarium duplospermum]
MSVEPVEAPPTVLALGYDAMISGATISYVGYPGFNYNKEHILNTSQHHSIIASYPNANTSELEDDLVLVAVQEDY